MPKNLVLQRTNGTEGSVLARSPGSLALVVGFLDEPKFDRLVSNKRRKSW